MSLHYEVRKGQLWFVYSAERKISGISGSYLIDIERKIPQHIVRQGRTAIRAYVERIVKKGLAKRGREIRAWEAFLANPNIPVSVKYRGILLEGRVESVTGANWLNVRLEKPAKYAGQASIQFNFASAMAGHYIFDGKKLSEHGLRAAQDLLIEIYRKNSCHEKPRDIRDLADKMNEEDRNNAE